MASDRYRREHPEYMKAYYVEHKQYFQEKDCDRARIAFDVLGCECVVCGETDPAVLQVDHINNDGAQHRQEGVSAKNLYQWIRDYPEAAKQRVQLLCANCHRRKHSQFRNCQ